MLPPGGLEQARQAAILLFGRRYCLAQKNGKRLDNDYAANAFRADRARHGQPLQFTQHWNLYCDLGGINLHCVTIGYDETKNQMLIAGFRASSSEFRKQSYNAVNIPTAELSELLQIGDISVEEFLTHPERRKPATPANVEKRPAA